MIFGGGNIGSGSLIGTGIVFSMKDMFSQVADNIMVKFNKLDGVTDRFTNKLQKNVKRLKVGLAGMALGGAMLAPFALATRTSMDFNQVMSEVISKTSDGAENADKLKAKAIELGKATKFSAMEAGQGMTYLAMAGFNAEQQLEAMPGLLSLAAAGNTDLATTADIVSDTLTAMNMKASEASVIADIMALGATRANTSIALMGETFKYSTATANQLGVSMSELTAMTGMIGDIGIKGSMAGTAINQMLLGLSQVGSSNKAQAALAQLGLTFSDLKDSQGNLRQMTDLIPLLSDRLKGISGNVNQTNIMQDIFGIRGAKAFAAFTKEGAKDFKKFVAELENSAGSASLIARMMMENLAGDVTIFNSTLESTLITIGSKIEPYLRPIVQMFTSLVSFIGDIVSTPLGSFLMGVTVALGLLLFVGGALLTVVALVGMASAQAAIGFTAMGLTAVGTAFATGGLTAGMAALGVAIWTALAPLLPILAALVGLVALYGAAKKASSEFQEVLEGNAKAETGFKGFMQRAGGVIQGLMHIWNNATEEGFTISDKMHEALSKLGILDFVVNLGTWIVRVKNFFRGIGEVFSEAYGYVRDFVKAAWDYLKPIIKDVFDSMGFSIDKATSKMEDWKKAGKAVGIALMIFLIPMLVSMAVLTLSVVAAIAVAVATMYLLYQAIMAVYHIVKAFVNVWIIGFKLIWDIVSGFYQFFVDIWNGKSVSEAGRNLVKNLKSGILTAWTDLKSTLVGLIADLPFGNKLLGYLGIANPNEQENVNVSRNDPPNTENPVDALNRANSTNKQLQTESNQPQYIDRSTTTEKVIKQEFYLDGEQIYTSVKNRVEEESTRE